MSRDHNFSHNYAGYTMGTPNNAARNEETEKCFDGTPHAPARRSIWHRPSIQVLFGPPFCKKRLSGRPAGRHSFCRPAGSYKTFSTFGKWKGRPRRRQGVRSEPNLSRSTQVKRVLSLLQYQLSNDSQLRTKQGTMLTNDTPLSRTPFSSASRGQGAPLRPQKSKILAAGWRCDL